jgi:hypothetical protein
MATAKEQNDICMITLQKPHNYCMATAKNRTMPAR